MERIVSLSSVLVIALFYLLSNIFDLIWKIQEPKRTRIWWGGDLFKYLILSPLTIVLIILCIYHLTH